MKQRVYPRASMQFVSEGKTIHVMRVSTRVVSDTVELASVKLQPLRPALQIHVKSSPDDTKGWLLQGHPIEGAALATAIEHLLHWKAPPVHIWLGEGKLIVRRDETLAIDCPAVTLRFARAEECIFVQALKLLSALPVAGEE